LQGPLLDKVKVQDQVQGGNGDHDQAEDDAHRPGPVEQGQAHPEQAQDETDQVKQHDAAGGRHYAFLKTLGGPDHSRLVSQQQRQAGPEGEAHRLDDDPGILGLGDGGDAANEQALQQGIEGSGHPGPGRFENGYQGHDEAGDGPQRYQGQHRLRVSGPGKAVPSPGGGDADAQQQQHGLVGGSLDGHPFLGPGNTAQPGEGEVTERGVARPHGEILSSGCGRFLQGSGGILPLIGARPKENGRGGPPAGSAQWSGFADLAGGVVVGDVRPLDEIGLAD